MVSNIAFYYSPVVRAQYAARNKGLMPVVQFNDITFAAHGVIMCIVTSSQYFYPRAWGFRPSPGGRPSRFILGVFLGCVAGVGVVVLVVLGSPARDQPVAGPWVWLDAVYAVSYVKLIITLIKYTPQVLVNYRNQSTEGWSILQILLDFTGGLLSIAQQAIDSYLQGDWSGITGNPVKFALGNVSMFYDLVFMAQHYVLYPDARLKVEGEEAPFARGRDGDHYGDEERRID